MVWPTGEDFFVRSFFSTVARRLEPQGRGSRFPALMALAGGLHAFEYGPDVATPWPFPPGASSVADAFATVGDVNFVDTMLKALGWAHQAKTNIEFRAKRDNVLRYFVTGERGARFVGLGHLLRLSPHEALAVNVRTERRGEMQLLGDEEVGALVAFRCRVSVPSWLGSGLGCFDFLLNFVGESACVIVQSRYSLGMSSSAVFRVDGPAPTSYVPTVLDADVAPDDVAAWAAAVTPGSAVVTPLVALDPRRLSYAGRVDALSAIEKQLSMLQAQQHRLLAVMAAEPVVGTLQGEIDKQWVREDVACALRLSTSTAADRLLQATVLSGLPDTLDVLQAGLISTHHARSMVEAVVALDAPTATAVEAAVLGKAPEQSLANFKHALRKALLVVAPVAAEERHDEAVTNRRVVRTPVNDGMSEIWMLLPDTGAATFMTAVNALARRVAKDDDRTADQRRADAVVQLALNTLHGTGAHGTSGELPREHGMRPSVQVTVALSTLLGLDEQPGELDGYGPIPATIARRIAADQTGTWRRLITDEHGRLLDYGRSTYRPPKDLTEHVIARDRTCRFPHCNRQARHSELDHERAWEAGGKTDDSNLHMLCSRHHHLKHDGGWTPKRQPDGSTDWVSPTGHEYTEEAATYPIDRTSGPGLSP